MNAHSRTKRLTVQLVGVVFLVVLALLGWFAVAVYNKTFRSEVTVTLLTERVGTQMDVGAAVKVRGVPFGRVSAIHTDGRGSRIELAINPGKITQLPRNISARLLPKSLFGQRYVGLVIPNDPHGTLGQGDTIPRDRSTRAIELERVLEDLLPLLRAVQPQKLNSSLTAISRALDGRGARLGEAIVRFNQLLAELNPLMDEFTTDVRSLADVAKIYNVAAPDILRALADLTVTGKTIFERRNQLSALFDSVTTMSGELDAFLRDNEQNVIRLAAAGRPTLELLARYSPEFPCLLAAIERSKPLMDKALGVGTAEPGLHVQLHVYPPRGQYVPGRDDPVYAASGGPRCPGGGGSGGGAAPPGQHPLLGELVAASIGRVPATTPGWGRLLIGPLLRGTEVTLR